MFQSAESNQRSEVGGRILVLLIAAACAVAGISLMAGPAHTQPVPVALREPDNDGGVLFAGPRQLAATCFTCPTARAKAVTLHNPSDTDQNPGSVNVRVGGSRVDAWPANKKNGIILTPGSTISIPMGGTGGAVCVISEAANDAGVAMGAMCSEGGN